MRYGMAIDLRRCMGCQACATSCKLANNLPVEVWYNTVLTDGGTTIDTCAGTYPNCTLQHYPVACQHCAEPACLEACPTGATQVREDGIVWVDNSICIGCDSCVKACPYEGVRTHIPSEPAYYFGMEFGEATAPTHVGDTVEKCTFCKNLVDEGRVPTCVEACVGYARTFGDLDDPESEISKLIASREVEQLKAEAGTKPSVYYLR